MSMFHFLVTGAIALVACTSGSISPRSVEPSPTGSAPRPDPTERSIELPQLPARGLVAGWSRDNSEGVSLMTLGGRVLATIPDFAIFQAGRMPPGLVILNRGEMHFWVLDVAAHELRRVSLYGADRLVEKRAPSSLPRDAFAWSVRAPGSTQVLAQYWQQVSECQKPVAMVRRAPGLEALPVTGDELTTAQPSYALGWTGRGNVVAAVARGPCDAGSGRFADGVYVFGGERPRRIGVPQGSYLFQMWD
jgi:hypothetical protein